MKKIFRLSALFCAMTLLVTSCTKDVLEEEQPNINPELVGTEIQFGARAGIENAGDTRTVYSNTTYTIGSKTFQLIEWLDYAIDETTGQPTGDMIEIFSPEAANGPSASYWVTDGSAAATDQKDAGVLVKVEDGALRWNGEGQHTFYGVYPSSKVVEGITFDASTKKLTGVISNQQHTQGVVVSKNDAGYTHYEMKPDMRYAYMVAKTTVDGPVDAVSFDFLPVVTAIRIVLALPEDSASSLYVNTVTLKGTGLMGTFTADLGNWSWTPGEAVSYPTCENTGTDTEDTITAEINVPDAAGNLSRLLLKRGETLAFTVFVRPGATINANSLTVSFSQDGFSNFKSKQIQSAHVIQPLVKTSLENLWLPSTQASITDYSDWMKILSDEVPMKNLSLPGAGGAFSSTSKSYKQQTLPFIADGDNNDLWDMGIRAFEFSCDRPQGSTPTNATSLNTQPIEVNGDETGWEVGEALRTLLDKVTAEGSQETAMAIITYQPKGTNYNVYLNTINRHAYTFALCLAKLYTELEAEYPGKMLLYTPETTLGDGTGANDARGKLMIICRVNQSGEPEPNDDNVNTASGSNGATTENAATNYTNAANYYNTNNIPILLINGCGTAKDRWGARGYKVNGNSVPDLTYDISADVMEYYMLGTLTSSFEGSWSGVITATWNGSVTGTTMTFDRGWPIEKKESNHGYDTNLTATTGERVWYNDWARVVDMNYIGTSPSHGMVVDGYYYSQAYPTQPANRWTTADRTIDAIRWFDSYDEKVADAIDTFNKAINSQNPGSQYNNYVFFNTLSCYALQPSEEYSREFLGDLNDEFNWSGGTRGDIAYMANKLNPAFGGYVREVIAAQEAGPTGVVLMDMVSNDVENGGASYYLPSVIISNNVYTGNVDLDKVEGGNQENENDKEDKEEDNTTENPEVGDEL